MIINWTAGTGQDAQQGFEDVWNWTFIEFTGVGPFCVQAVQDFVPGSIGTETFSAGATEMESFNAGSNSTQTGCP